VAFDFDFGFLDLALIDLATLLGESCVVRVLLDFYGYFGEIRVLLD
jgi:hypothetical protein